MNARTAGSSSVLNAQKPSGNPNMQHTDVIGTIARIAARLEAISQMPEQDNNAAEKDEAAIIICVIFKSRQNSPVILEPREQSFNFPSSPVSPQRPAVLRLSSRPYVRCDHFNAELGELGVQPIRVVCFVSDQSFGSFLDERGFKRGTDKGDFMRRSRRDVDGDRKTSAVCNCHDLRTFAPLGRSNTEPPFLATTKVPSMKHSERSSPPRSWRSSARARKTRSRTPSLTQAWYLRWQVWYGGYRPGRSFHGAPVRNTQIIPLRTSRLSRHGRPRPSSRTGGSGISGSRIAHCSSVRSMCQSSMAA